MLLLSKSDFKVARTCGTKLYYKKLRYPSNLDENPYLEFLADGGFMVEALAKSLFPKGEEMPFDSNEKAAEFTMNALGRDEVTLFEATVIFGQLLARIDILEKRGNSFRLIEVKAKGFGPESSETSPFRGKRGEILSEWRPYLEDLTFQTHVLQSAFPSALIMPFLCLVDKSKSSHRETVFEKFQVLPGGEKPTSPALTRPAVKFIGDVKSLRRKPIVTLVKAAREVRQLLPEVTQAAATFAASLAGKSPERIPPNLGVRCKHCEYRLSRLQTAEKNGFQECWGKLAASHPHLLDLYRVDALGLKGQVAAKMIAEGRCSIRDISESDLRGEIGKRQGLQLAWTLKNEEFISEKLKKVLEKCKYPLHFMDFEASRIAVSYHAGMRPYEQVAFQWSCHTIPEKGGDLDHQDWINVEDAYPNFKFARSLQKIIERDGTVFVWSPFERSALIDIRRQLVQYAEQDRALASWLKAITSRRGPLVDLCLLAKKYYFHPAMGGSLSIKDVLPAVWFQNTRIRAHPWFAKYAKEKDGRILEPYETLEPLPFGDNGTEGQAEAVREGTGAIRTYQEMMYGLRRTNASFREAKTQLLLNYCELDTAAMVMIWMHWISGGK